MARWQELTQASSDFSVVCKRPLQVNSVQKMLKTSEYGVFYLWHMDSHQIANVTILSRAHWQDPIESSAQWLLFPAWRHVRVRGIDRFARPVVPARVVAPSYLHDRIQMQLSTCAVTRDMRKALFLKVRTSVWSNAADVALDAMQRHWQAAADIQVKQAEAKWVARVQTMRAVEEERN